MAASDTQVATEHHIRADRTLASGVPPESHPALTLRARALIAPTRTGLARQVQRVVRDARLVHRSLAAQIPTRRREVIATADELEALARRLLARGPVSAHGVAQVRVLLTDASRPLYHPGARHRLRTAAARALHDLEVQLECW